MDRMALIGNGLAILFVRTWRGTGRMALAMLEPAPLEGS
jgi:hypothetical protein